MREMLSAAAAAPVDESARFSALAAWAGRKFLKRFRLRTKDRDPEVSEKAALAQRTAIAQWGAERERPWDYLKTSNSRRSSSAAGRSVEHLLSAGCKTILRCESKAGKRGERGCDCR